MVGAGGEDAGERSDTGREQFHTSCKTWQGERRVEAEERRSRGRPTKRELLARAKDNPGDRGARLLFGKWRMGGESANRSEEGARSDDKRGREEEEEKEKEKARKRRKQRSPGENPKKGGFDMDSLGMLITGFREEVCNSLADMRKRDEEVREEMRRDREKWEELEIQWRKKKGKMWEKLGDMEEEQRRGERGERRVEMEKVDKLEKRVRKLEQREQ